MDTLELLRGCLDCLQAGCTALARGHLAEWRRLGTTRHEPLARLLSIGIDLQEREDRDEALPASLLDSLLVRCRQDLAAQALAGVLRGEVAPQARALADDAVPLADCLGACLGYHLTERRDSTKDKPAA
jgi:hypothetical protein